MPVPDSLDQHYDVPVDTYWKDNYFKSSSNYLGSQIRKAKELLGDRPDLKALDVGSGIGKAFASLEKNGFSVTGIEPSPSFHAAALKNGVSPEKLINTSLEDAQFPEKSFDFINLGAVLEHLVNPHLAMQKAVTWLKDGGVIHVEVPNAEWLSARLARAFHRLKGSRTVVNTSPMHPPYHLYEFTRKSFEENGRLLGYTIAAEQYYVCESYLPKIIDRPARALMKAGKSGMQLGVWLKKTGHVH